MTTDNLFKQIVRQEVPLAMHTWLQLGGPAEFFAEPRSRQELVELLQQCKKDSIPVHILGMGSNILVSDKGVPGVVIRLTAPDFCDIQLDGTQVEAGGGARLGRVITSAVHAGLGGLEGLIGIPGTVGGAVYENASAGDGEIGQWVDQVGIVTFAGEYQELSRKDIVFGYHNCSIANAVVVWVKFRLEQEDARELSKRMQKIWIVRKKTQPMGWQNAGRLFKNPRGQNAAELIESVGLCGTKIGGAVVSQRNANYVVVEPECSCNDIKRLVNLIQSQVMDRMEIELELELELW